MRNTIADKLLEFGITPNLKGFHYLIGAISIAIERPRSIFMVTKDIYPTVARWNGVSASMVERDIRHAIEVAFDNGSQEMIEETFGRAISKYSGKVKNGEFIAIMAEKIGRVVKEERNEA